MKRLKQRLIYSIMVTFAIVTVLIIIYAFRHRDADDLVYLIFNSYALLAVLLSFLFVLYWQRVRRKRMISEQKRLRHLVKNLTAPAMLWDDDLKSAELNEALMRAAELDPEEMPAPKQLIPQLFGREHIDDEAIREIVLSKNQEYVFPVGEDRQRSMVWNTSAVHTDEEGLTYFLSIGVDLENIRLMESELRSYSRRLAASENRNMLTMELTDIGILLIELHTHKLYPSEKLQRMIGLSGEHWTAKDLRSLVYPMDLALFDRHVKTIRNHVRDYMNTTQVLELRLSGADKRYRWYSYRFKALQVADGGVIIGGAVIDISKEKEKDAQIEQIAYEDAVTAIPNRNRLMNVGEELYLCTKELDVSYWVIVMDIDRFHLINDTCGYANGNELLKRFARALEKELTEGGFGARISGDNFALILHDTGDEKLPVTVVKRIQKKLAALAVGKFENRSLTCSAGYARMPHDGGSFEEVMERAEFALSTGKSVNGAVTGYTEQMHDTIIRESNIEKELRRAIEKNELVLYYQPKIALDSGAVIGLEALVRWKKPDGTMVPPEVFIPVAERTPLIMQITRFVIREACRQAKEWQKKGLPEIVMSVNMSGMDFYQDNVCNVVAGALKKNTLPPRFLEIELTESLALKDIDLTVSRMKQLRVLGVQIAMDDFGTGYSSLSYLRSLPFTMLKLDRSFVMHMADDLVVQEIVSSVVRIAKAKGIRTIAEGVETPQQAQQLRLLGCDYVQGYLYGKPMSAEDTEAFIRRNQTERKVY
ncbi:MAG: bifunctional diguanylate cyclase/phosphodiesterase [Oscillospiraceae bacterium]|nr:bifunctional diguanylate cyclase/phosphodiesterase [Oscillospiraceae bacterium]